MNYIGKSHAYVHCFGGYEISVPDEFLVYDLFFKNKGKLITHEDE